MNTQNLSWWINRGLIGVLGITLLARLTTPLPLAFIDSVLLIGSIVGTLLVSQSAFRSLRERKISVDLLASIALVVSIVAHDLVAASFINLMLAAARLFGDYTENRARAALKSLSKLRPERVKVKRGDTIADVPLADIRIGDLVLVGVGEHIPVDGSIEAGSGEADQSALTGESLPVEKNVGDMVFSSTTLISGNITIRAEKIGTETTLERIIALVSSAAENKSSIKTLADTFAGWYIGGALILSVLIFVFTQDVNLVLSLLLVVCADDIAVAIPLAYVAAIGYAAKRGIIIKSPEFLEGLARLTTLVVDKTGTITEGKLVVSSIHVAAGIDTAEFLGILGTIESLSTHPIARAIAEYATAAHASHVPLDEFREIPGKGMLATVHGLRYTIGKPSFLETTGLVIPNDAKEALERSSKEGHTIIIAARGNDYFGFLACRDTLRRETQTAFSRLRELGVKRIVMLTGDNAHAAQTIAHEAGISEYRANLLPEGKIIELKKILGEKRGTTAMIGDGVNDAASLALADIGIAMGRRGSDATIEAADITLMHDDLHRIGETIELGRYTLKIARQDFVIWVVSNVIGIALVFGGYIGPEGAAAYNFFSDFFPLINSLRLFNLHQIARPQVVTAIS